MRREQQTCYAFLAQGPEAYRASTAGQSQIKLPSEPNEPTPAKKKNIV
jgi:hypothetical protein